MQRPMLRIVQLSHPVHGRRVAVVSEPYLRLLQSCSTVYELARSAIQSNEPLRKHIELDSGDRLEYDDVYAGRSDWKLLSPIDHPEPSRCFVTGTGLTHKGSADNRQSMHVATASQQNPTIDSQSPAPSPQSPTDSMKMFQIGLEGGGPSPVRSELRRSGLQGSRHDRSRAQPASLVPSHGLDGGEEAEIAGVYIIGADGTPHRIGLAQGNEFSDHVMESKNYLYLAPSKLRDCSLGPEIVVEPTFDDVSGQSTIERRGKVIWQAATSDRRAADVPLGKQP